MAYATFDELMLRYPDLTANDETAELRLEDATRAIRRAIRPYGGEDAFDPDVLAQVCCDIAARALYPNPMGLGADVSQVSTTVGAISEQLTFSNSGGNCRPLKSDLLNLGIPGGRIGSVFISG